MPDQSDVTALRYARNELSKRGIDYTRADVHAMHGVIYMRGAIFAIPGSGISDLEAELIHVVRNLRQRAEIRDVIMELTYPQQVKQKRL